MIWQIEKLISGAQEGSDTGGLVAAELYGIPTGGYMTKGCKTIKGTNRERCKRFGLTELSTLDYPTRTAKNVEESDGTIRLAFDFSSYGELCTLKAIKKFKKPYFDVKVGENFEIYYNNEYGDCVGPKIDECIEWLMSNEIKILNVAGNCDQACFDFTVEFLSNLFERLGYARRD